MPTDLPSSAPAGSPPLDKRISEIRKRLAAATPRPWFHVQLRVENFARNTGGFIAHCGSHDDLRQYVTPVHPMGWKPAGAVADAAFIANAPDDLEYLLSQLSALSEENERLTKLPRWWLPAVLDGPFTPMGDGGDDGCVRDVIGRIVADCHGSESRANVIAELLNRASSPPLDRVRSNG